MRIECDRCGHIYEESGVADCYKHPDGQEWFMNSEIILRGVVLFGQDPRDIHLCPECTYKLKQWVDNYETDKE